MKKNYSSSSNIFCDIVPEIDQYEVRYSEYILKTPKNKSLDNRKRLAYGAGPIVENEIDDPTSIPNYTDYILCSPKKEECSQENKIKKKTKTKEELSLNIIASTMKQITHKALTKFIINHKNEFIRIKKKPPDKKYLHSANILYEKMFNPEQKLSMYYALREIFNISPHQFEDTQFLFSIMLQEVAVMLLQKKFKFKNRKSALEKFVILTLLDL
ncbi:uncharacterized protein LOC126907471 [Daktulosphaira vitifoliae]|uniref:uncharacterized protein LOC126907471 n=1 Tax=Daktulosphaira vitifoliae TaxID=58002 RepID=UPI0021AA7E97|nr:uncharacterized protein LOC126907471 [Daktulosphaira vitifoliae]